MKTWYEKWNQRLQKEKFEMEKRHPKLSLEKMDDGRLMWFGELYNNNNISYHVKIVYPPDFPMRSPRVYPMSLDDPRKTLNGFPSHQIHTMADGSLCLAYPKFESPHLTAADVADAARLWLLGFESYIKTGKWFLETAPKIAPKIENIRNEDVTIHNFGTITNLPIQQGTSDSSQDITNYSLDVEHLLNELTDEIEKIIEILPENSAREVKQDLEIFKSEVKSKKPRKKWCELSAEGLIKAATNLGAIGKPVLELVAQILPLIRA